MFAKYVVLNRDDKPIPVLIPPWDANAWGRWVTQAINIRDVLAAGEVTWGYPTPSSINCSGEAGFYRSSGSSRQTMRKNRGYIDAELVRELLSQPLEYVVLNLEGLGERPLLVTPGDSYDSVIARYQGPGKQVLVSAGLVQFDLMLGEQPECSGSVQLGNWLQPVLLESRGEIDALLLEKFFDEALL